MTIERIPEAVTHRPEEVEVPPAFAETGLSAIEREFKTHVRDSKGQNILISPATQQVTIKLPYDKATLTGWLKGSVSSSLTWFATFWLRIIKKALHFGWHMTGKGGGDATGS